MMFLEGWVSTWYFSVISIEEVALENERLLNNDADYLNKAEVALETESEYVLNNDAEENLYNKPLDG